MHLFRSGFAVGINRAGGAGPPRCFALVIRGGATGEPRALVDRILRCKCVARPRTGRITQVDRPDGRKLHVLEGSAAGHLAWWTEGDDLVVSLVSPADSTRSSRRSTAASPMRSIIPTALPWLAATMRRASSRSAGFFDMAALPPLPREAVGLGLDRIKRFDYRWGFHGQALQSIVGVVVPPPANGHSRTVRSARVRRAAPASAARRAGGIHRALAGSCPVLERHERGARDPGRERPAALRSQARIKSS